MWYKLIQTFVDNPVSKSSPCIVRVERQHIMLKLKIMTAALAVASLILLLTGSTYFTAALSVICTATTLLPAGYLMWRWLLDDRREAIMVPLHYLGSSVRIDSSTSTQRYRDHRHPAWHCNEPGESSGIGKLRIVYEYPTDFSRGSRAVVAHARQQ